MIDPVVCSGMSMGTARADPAALIELNKPVTGGDEPALFRGGLVHRAATFKKSSPWTGTFSSSRTRRWSPTTTASSPSASRRLHRSDGGDVACCCEVGCELVISSCDASPILEAAEGAFDDIPALIGLRVEGLDLFSGWIVGDHRLGTARDEESAKRIAVICSVGGT
tara:strand:- start:583 stop:1083 length:501 start_codon:yes stop_codon:yes gene_type:complete